MIVNFLLAIFILVIVYCFAKNCIVNKNGNSNFLSKESTGALRGAAIIAIVFSHVCQDAPELNDLLIGGKYTYTVIFSWGGIGVAIFFLLSGFGCYLSIKKSKNILIWCAKHIVKLLIYFVIAFAFVLLANCFILGNTFTAKEWLLSFVTIRFPGTTSWYFKIQLLFYILLAVSERIKHRQCWLISIYVLVYAIIADYCGLSDYWWKTSMCFAAGCALAEYKDKIIPIIEKVWVKIIIVLLGCGAFVYTRIDFHYILPTQLIAYICISGCVVVVWDWIIRKNKMLERIGKASLAMYLVHIGVVDSAFELNMNINVKVIAFVAITVIGTVICYLLSEKINKPIAANFKDR